MTDKTHFVQRLLAEDIDTFNMSRLLLILHAAEGRSIKGGLSLERLVYYEFFSAHPYLVFKKEDPEWRELIAEGHGWRTLGYSNPAHRFVSRRERAKRFVAGLVARGLVRVNIDDGHVSLVITEEGKGVSSEMRSLYSMEIGASARLVIKKLTALSDKRLVEHARIWLGGGLILLDLGE